MPKLDTLHPLGNRPWTVVLLLCTIAASAGGGLLIRVNSRGTVPSSQRDSPTVVTQQPAIPSYQFQLIGNDFPQTATGASKRHVQGATLPYVRRFTQPSLGGENVDFVFKHQRRHDSLVMVSPTLLVSADTNAFAWLNLETGETERRDLVRNRKYIFDIVESRDRRMIIGGGSGSPLVQLNVDSKTVTFVPIDAESADAQGMSATGAPQDISADSKYLLYLNNNQPNRRHAPPRAVVCDLETGSLRKLKIDIKPTKSNEARRESLSLEPDVTNVRFLSGDDLIVATGWWQGLRDHSFIVAVERESGEIIGRLEVPHALDEAFSVANEALVIATAHSGGISLWTWTDSEIESSFELDVPGVLTCSIALSNDGNRLAAIDNKGLVSLWDLQTKQRQILGTHGAEGLQVIFSPDQSQVVSSALDGRIRVWRTSSIVDSQFGGGSVKATTAPSAKQVAISPDGQHLAITDGNDRVQIWDAHSGKGVLELSIAGADSIQFSSSQSCLVVMGKDRVLTLVDLQKLGSVKHVPYPAPDRSTIPKRFREYLPDYNNSTRKSPLQLSRDGNIAGCAGSGYLQIFNLDDPEHAITLSNVSWNASRSLLRSQTFTAIAVNGDGGLVAGAALDHLKIWRSRTGELLQAISIRNGLGRRSSLSFASDGSQIACLADDKAAVFDVQTGKPVHVIENATAATLFDNASGKLLHGNLMGEVTLTDLNTQDSSVLFSIDEPVESISVDENGCVVVKGGSSNVHIFEPIPEEFERQRNWKRLPNKEFLHVRPGEIIPEGQTFAQWRERFQTNILGFESTPQTQRISPPASMKQVTYTSMGQRMKALLHQPKDTSVPLPGLVFLHGGFTLSPEDLTSVTEITQDRFVVMAPAMRGENGNPGTLEMMCGEVDDARAAIHWLASQSFVDPKRIYAFGHSIGGATSALLSLRSNVPIEHSGSCGGIYPEFIFDEWVDTVPFANTPAERKARLLVGNLLHMQRKHFAFLGNSDPLLESSREISPGSKLTIETVPGDHFTSFDESLRRYISIIQRDEK